MTVGVSFGLDRRRGHASPPPGSCPVWHPAVASFVAVALALELVGAVLHAASDVGERKVDRRVVPAAGRRTPTIRTCSQSLSLCGVEPEEDLPC